MTEKFFYFKWFFSFTSLKTFFRLVGNTIIKACPSCISPRTTHSMPRNSAEVRNCLIWCTLRSPERDLFFKIKHCKCGSGDKWIWIFPPSYTCFLMEVWDCCYMCVNAALHALFIERNLIPFVCYFPGWQGNKISPLYYM